MQLYCQSLEGHGGGHFQTTWILNLNYPQIYSEEFCSLSLFLECWLNNFLVGKQICFSEAGLWWKDWVLWLELTHVGVLMQGFLFSKQKISCCPGWHLFSTLPTVISFLQAGSQTKPKLARSFVISRFSHCFRRFVPWNKMYKLPGMFWHVHGWFPVICGVDMQQGRLWWQADCSGIKWDSWGKPRQEAKACPRPIYWLFIISKEYFQNTLLILTRRGHRINNLK